MMALRFLGRRPENEGDFFKQEAARELTAPVIQTSGRTAVRAVAETSAEHEVREDLEVATDAMSNLVQELAPGIKSGRWDSLIGDDASGRLPALVIGKIMDRYAREHGTPQPERVFVAAGKIRPGEEPDGFTNQAANRQKFVTLRRHIGDSRERLGERALVVTEHVKGNGITMLGKALHDNGVDFDLAVVDTRYTADKMLEAWRGYFPDEFAGTELYKGSEHIQHTVFKDGTALLRARGITRDPLSPIAVPDDSNRDYVQAGRTEVSYLADELYSRHFEE
jgi:hypothetical protein